MENWYHVIASESRLAPESARQLRDIGFLVLPGPVIDGGGSRLSDAYDKAVLTADPDDISLMADELVNGATDDYQGQALACGPAGSIIIFNGSVWHGHTANRSPNRRRSIQGAFVPRDARSAINHASRIRHETFERIGDLAKYLLDVA